MKIRQALSNAPMARALRKLARLREQDVGDIAAEWVNSERVTAAVQKRINQVLHVQRMASEAMGKILGAVNISSRDDVQSVASKLGAVEDVMAQLQVEVRQLRVALAERNGGAVPPAVVPVVKRTRRPPPDRQG